MCVVPVDFGIRAQGLIPAPYGVPGGPQRVAKGDHGSQKSGHCLPESFREQLDKAQAAVQDLTEKPQGAKITMDNAGSRVDEAIQDLRAKQKDATAAVLQEAAAEEHPDRDVHDEPWNAGWQTTGKSAKRNVAKKPAQSAAEKHT